MTQGIYWSFWRSRETLCYSYCLYFSNAEDYYYGRYGGGGWGWLQGWLEQRHWDFSKRIIAILGFSKCDRSKLILCRCEEKREKNAILNLFILL